MAWRQTRARRVAEQGETKGLFMCVMFVIVVIVLCLLCLLYWSGGAGRDEGPLFPQRVGVQVRKGSPFCDNGRGRGSHPFSQA